MVEYLQELRVRDIYSSDGKKLEIIDNIITEVR